jgi:hypothetical protein
MLNTIKITSAFFINNLRNCPFRTVSQAGVDGLWDNV